mmetsp:Transcript_7765/g.11521  ORF Transcript_7765/g.11521 Transcript_7765/m.11521 type:complete len:305 (+) Transcript_7765:69-983(+)
MKRKASEEADGKEPPRKKLFKIENKDETFVMFDEKKMIGTLLQRAISMCDEETIEQTKTVVIVGEGHDFSELQKIKNVTSLTISECDDLNPNIFHTSLKSLHALETLEMMISIKEPLIIENHQMSSFLLNFSQHVDLHLSSTSVKSVSFSSCSFASVPELHGPFLQNLRFTNSRNLTDRLLYQILSQFEELHVTMKDRKCARLESLSLFDCPLLENPHIESSTLLKLILNACESLKNPIIKCIHLHTLDIKWCEQLQNMLLGCNTLQKLDLKGSAAALENDASYRDLMINSLRQHYHASLEIHT